MRFHRIGRTLSCTLVAASEKQRSCVPTMRSDLHADAGDIFRCPLCDAQAQVRHILEPDSKRTLEPSVLTRGSAVSCRCHANGDKWRQMKMTCGVDPSPSQSLETKTKICVLSILKLYFKILIWGIYVEFWAIRFDNQLGISRRWLKQGHAAPDSRA